jgi:hypothetical protein
VAVVGVGIWAIVAANQTNDIDIATQLMDDFNDGWNTNDPEAIAAVFTEDGTFIDAGGRSPSGQDALMLHAKVYDDRVTGVERLEELTATGSGTFTAPVKFVAGGGTWVVICEIELDGDLASRIEQVEVIESGY